MIKFMVIAAPRSGTAWAANWLTTDQTLCLHDPLWQCHYSDLDAIVTRRPTLGIACTGAALFADWVNSHPARKVVLHRPIGEINESLDSIGMPPLQADFESRLMAIDGLHCYWRDIFEKPRHIWRHLLPEVPMDWERHKMLTSLEVQMNFEGIRVDRAATRRLLLEVEASMVERFN